MMELRADQRAFVKTMSPRLIVASLLVTLSVFASAQQPSSQPAPELVQSDWLNVPKGPALTLASRAGRVTIVHFWTFACSNCRANLKAYDRLYAKFQSRGVEMIGIHTPELQEERDPANVAASVKKLGIRFPVLIDGDGKNWSAWHQEYWPTFYIVDKKGRIRYRWVGEFQYKGQDGETDASRWLDFLLREPN